MNFLQASSKYELSEHRVFTCTKDLQVKFNNPTS